MNVQKSLVKERLKDAPPVSGTALGLAAATGTDSPPEISNRVGIERAFDVIRHHTVHTKGYVMTALKLIEEYGTASDKALLEDLLHKNGHSPEIAISRPPSVKKKPAKKK